MFLLLGNGIVSADDNLELMTQEELIEAASDVKSEQLPNINSRAAIIYDRTTGEVIWGKNETQKRPMASTTKIMTAIVVIENCDLEETVEISKRAAGTGGSRLGLKTGDKITIRDLLYGLMLCSGNDAAVALAERVGGNLEGFAEKMNQKAKQLQLQNTHFVTPHGLDATEHYTTALELAKMADYGMRNKTFSEIVSSKTYTIMINGYPKALSNTNELLGYLEGVNGVKTGFTNGANRCLVTSVIRGNMSIITVVLGADTKKFRTADSMKLISYAYENYELISVEKEIQNEFTKWKEQNLNKIELEKANVEHINVELNPVENPNLIIPKKEEEDISIKIDCIPKIAAPKKRGERIGSLKVYVGTEKRMDIPICLQEDILKKDIWDYMIFIMKQYKTIDRYCF